MKLRWLFVGIASLVLAVSIHGEDKTVVAPNKKEDLTLEKSVRLALEQNPDILKAKQEIQRTRGLVIEIRAQALPHLSVSGNYDQQDKNLLEGSRGGGGGSSDFSSNDFVPDATGDLGTEEENIASTTQFDDVNSGNFSSGDKSWRVAFEVNQILYSGGQVRAAMKIAKLTEDTALYELRDTVDRIIATVRRQFYNVLVTRELIKVQEESTQLLQEELTDQQNRFDAGTVPRFNVLRAEVELSNVRPELIRAKNNYFIAQLELAKILGIRYDEAQPEKLPFQVVGKLDPSERPFDLKQSLEIARERRAFLKAQRQAILIEMNQIKIALAGYKPTLRANGGYEIRNSRLSEDLEDTVEGWFFGVRGNWNIFDGLETYGKTKQAKARLESAKINYDDSVRQVELEVQQAYARVQEAKELIASQQKNIEQAEEALRLARERFSVGAATQLEILDARVALTRARVTKLQALYDYYVALAEFDRVTGIDTQYTEMFDDPLTHKKRKKD